MDDDYLDQAIGEGLRDWAILEGARQSMYSTEENIKRGNMAMRHVIETHTLEPKAMWRKELGWIGFEWGTAGEAPPEFKDHAEFRKWQKSGRRPFDKGGHGIAHIIAKRDWEGKHIEEFIGQSGKTVAFQIVGAIAHGAVNAKGATAEITWQDMGIYLRKKAFGGEVYWLISGYHMPVSGYRYKPESGR